MDKQFHSGCSEASNLYLFLPPRQGVLPPTVGGLLRGGSGQTHRGYIYSSGKGILLAFQERVISLFHCDSFYKQATDSHLEMEDFESMVTFSKSRDYIYLAQ